MSFWGILRTANPPKARHNVTVLRQYNTQSPKCHRNLEFCHRDFQGPQQQNSLAENKVRWPSGLILCCFWTVLIHAWQCISGCISMMLVLKSLITAASKDKRGNFTCTLWLFISLLFCSTLPIILPLSNIKNSVLVKSNSRKESQA